MPGRRIRHVADQLGAQIIEANRLASNEGTGHADELAIRSISAVLAGDREAFRALVERESRAVVAVCYRVLGNRHDAEDAAQEAFVIAYRALGTWRGEGPFGAWLARIAVRVAIRQAARQKALPELTWIEPPGSGTGDDRAGVRGGISEGRLASTAGGPNGDPALVLAGSERKAQMRAAVAGLPEPYREVVALRFFGELSLDEIANEIGRPIGTVKTHLRRGLVRLKVVLEAES